MSNKNVTLSQLQKSVGSFKNYIQSNINIPYNDINCYTLTPTIINNQFTNSDYIIFNSDTVSKAIINLDEPLNELLRDQKNILFTVIEDLDSTDTVNCDMLYYSSTDGVMNYAVSYKSAKFRIYMYNNVTISFDENGNFVKTESTGKSSICLKYTLEDSTVINTLNLKYTIYCNCLNKNCFTQIDLVRGKSRNSIQSYNLQDGCNTGRSSINLTEDSSIGSYSYITGVSNTVDVYSESVLIFGRYNDVGKNFQCSSINGRYNIIDSNTRGANNLYIDIHGNKNHIYNSPAGYTDNVFINGQYLNISNSYTMAFGKYGDVPTTLMFALCNGTSETDKKVIFGIDRTGLAITDAVPTEDSHLTNKKYVDDKVASLVDSAPETLDTLKELSTALGDDPNFATTMATTLGNKVDKVDGKTLSTNDLTNELKANYDTAYTHSQSVHFDGDYNSLNNIPTDLVKTSDADSKYASIEYVDSNMVIRKLPVHSTTETDKAIIYYVNVMDLLKGAQYATFINPNDERAQQYRIVYVCDDDTVTNIVSLPPGTNINIVKATHYTNYSNVVYNNIKYKVDYTNHSTSSDVIITKTLISYLPTNNTIEYEPTYEYNPATKKYVDDKFYQTGLMEEVGTIPCSEMQNCNNGTSRYVSSINFDELFSGYEDHVFYGIYDSDKLIRIRYDSTYNRLVTNKLAISGTESIALGFDLGTHVMYPFNAGKSDVKAYTFTNDLVIKRVPVFDVNKAATKQYVDDSINSIPKQLVPLSTLIAEDTDGYAYLELNQFEKDKTYIILDDVSTNKFVYATSFIKFKLDGVLLSGAMLFLRTYFPYITLGIKSSTNTLYFGNADTFWSYDLTNNSKEKNESYSLSMKANKSNVLEKNNTTEYIPTTDYNPATKKYVDDTAETLVKKDTNKYKLITCDDPLVIAKSDITDLTDATISIDNLIGQFGNLITNEDSTYTYTLNTIMTDVETFTFKVNNIEQKLVIVPYKEMTYDDKNAGITYEGNWYEDTNDNYYKQSSHYTKGTDNSTSTLSFIFTGTAVKFIGMTSKALGQNRIRSQIFIVNSDGSVGSTSSYTKITDNMITSTDDILYNTSIAYNNIDNELGYGKYKSVLTAGKGSSCYVDKIIVYNTIQKLNDSIESLYNQKEATPTVLRTDIPNARFDPKELYDPATKYYVDKTINNNKVNMCTDEEITSMLTEVLGVDYSATE